MRSFAKTPYIGLYVAVAVAGLLFCFGCGGDDGVTPEPPADSTTIGPAGGTVHSADGTASVVIPPGALDSEVAITVEEVATYPAGPLAGTVYEFGPDGTQFSALVAVGLKYDPVELPPHTPHEKLRLARLAGGVWLESPDCAVDSVTYVVTDSVTHFSTWGIVTDSGDAVIDSTAVYVVDSPAPGDPTQFATLAEALAYLDENLDYEDIGRVIIQTNTTQTVAALSFPFFLQLVVDDGYSCSLAGPGSSPLVVSAMGAFALRGFTVVNSGGLLINANQHLDVSNNNLPAGTAVAIGGVKGAFFPAGDPAYKGRESKQGTAGGANFSGNAFGGTLDWYFNAGVSNAYSYNVINNSGTGIAAAGEGYLSGGATLNFDTNNIQDLYIKTAFGLNGNLKVENHNSNPAFEVDSPVDGVASFDFRHNAFASATIGAKGVGELGLVLRSNDLGDGRINVGLGAFRIDSMNQTANSLLVGAATLIQEVAFDWTSTDDSVDDAFTVDLYDNFEDTMVNMYFSNLFVGGNLGFGFSGRTEVELTDGCTLNAEFRAHIDKDVLHLRIIDATFYGRAYVEVDDWRAGVMVEGIGVSYHEDLQVNFPRAAFAFIEFGEGANFSGGKSIAVGDYDYRKRQLPGWNAPPGTRSPLYKQGEAAIRFNGATLTFDGYAHLDINQVDAPVTITGCTITQSGGPTAMAIEDCSAAVTVNDNNFTGAGFGLINCPGPITITDNQMNVTNGGAIAIGLGTSGATSVTGNTVTCSAGAGFAFTSGDMTGTTTVTDNTFNASGASGCLFVGTGTVYADNNGLLAGNIFIVEGPLHISDNTLQCDSFIDAWPDGGLMNDPVEDNSGLDPFSCFTFVDFDGNGCCEYPPPANEKDENGNCGCDGVSPAGG